MAGLELFNKPDLDKRITFPCKDVAGAVEHLAYKLDATTKKMTVAGTGDVIHGLAYVSAAQNVETGFDTDGILVGIASGAIEVGDPLIAANGGKFATNVGAGKNMGYAVSKAADGQKVAFRATFG